MQDGESTGDAARPPAPVRPPTEQLRTIQQLNESFARHLRESLTVNSTDLDAMQHLIVAGSLSPGDLSKRLGLSSAAVTSVIDRLEVAGHAAREPHPSDRRALLVVPSPGSVGKALGEVMPMVAKLDSVLEDFSDEEQSAIVRYLDAVIAAYREHLDTRAIKAAPGERDERAS